MYRGLSTILIHELGHYFNLTHYDFFRNEDFEYDKNFIHYVDSKIKEESWWLLANTTPCERFANYFMKLAFMGMSLEKLHKYMGEWVDREIPIIKEQIREITYPDY